jgi:hypothetical protein
MQSKTERSAALVILICAFIIPLEAQHDPEPFRRLNSNVGFVVSAPVSHSAAYTSIGWGFVYGAGYNISKHHSLIGEVMWNSLGPNAAALAPIRAASQDSSINGHGNIVTLTGNYRLKFEGKVYGTYFIGGAGLYYRDVSFSRLVSVGNSVSCDPAWLWWGFSCSSGVVATHQSLTSFTSTALGGNVGVGFTARIPDSNYTCYIETRYHYSPTKGAHTQLVPITVGIRF